MKLFFMHIEKTGGTSVSAYLEQNYHENAYHSRTCRTDLSMSTKPIKKMSIDALRGYDLVHSHLSYQTLQDLGSDYRSFTMLREPVSRCISQYKDWKFSKSDAHIEYASSGFRRFWKSIVRTNTLDELVQCGDPVMRRFLCNRQTRMLSGDTKSDEPSLDLALKNLYSFDVVGLTEQFEQSMEHLRLRMGWTYKANHRAHLNRALPASSCFQVGDEALAVLEHWNRADTVVYQEACKLFASQETKIAEQGFAHKDEVLQKSSLGSQYSFRMSEKLVGEGWYQRESHPAGTVRWSGPDQKSFLDIPPMQTDIDYILLIGLVCAIDQEVYDRTRYTINGHLLQPIGQEVAGHQIQQRFAVPGSVLHSDKSSRVFITTPKTITHNSIEPTVADHRPKGVAITGFDLLPAKKLR
jgi:hypothetical protein